MYGLGLGVRVRIGTRMNAILRFAMNFFFFAFLQREKCEMEKIGTLDPCSMYLSLLEEVRFLNLGNVERKLNLI